MFGVDDLISSGIGLAGNIFTAGTNDAEEEALRQQQQALNLFTNQPEYSEPLLNYDPTLYQTPEDMTAAQITEDPSLKAAQMAALNNMMGLTESGISAASQRDYDLARRKTQEENRGQQEAIINDMASRGVAGGGLEFALRERAAQEASDRLSQEGTALEAQKANTRLQALNNMLTGAGNVRGQDLAVSSKNTDALNKFTEENSRRKWATKNANVDLTNQAQLTNKQDVKGAYQNQYNSDAQRRTNQANAINKQAATNQALGEQQRTNNQNLFASGGKVAGSIYDIATSDPKKKLQGAA